MGASRFSLWGPPDLEPRCFESREALVAALQAAGEAVLVEVPVEDVDAMLGHLRPGDDVLPLDTPPALRRFRRERFLAALDARDPLTGLLHRRALQRAAEVAIEQKEMVSLVLIDIDHFKALNDEHGHLAGDRVLRELAASLMETRPAGAVVARYGGEEMALLVRAGIDESIDVADAICARVRELRLAGHQLTISIGVSTSRDGDSAEALFERASEALYASKAQGRDRVMHVDRLARDVEGDFERRIASFEDFTRVVAERVADVISRRGSRLLREMRQQADLDPLTETFNRRYLDRRLPFDLERMLENSEPLTVALLDIDHFGDVNKKHGWPTGDRVLAAVADAVRRSVREEDWVARYGGEELCLVLAVPLEGARTILERVRSAVERTSAADGEGTPVGVTVSLGASQARQGDSALDLLERTSKQLLDAKNAGRNRVVVEA